MKFAKTCLILTFTFVLGMNTVAFGATKYTDVPADHWAYDSINSIAEKGYMVGNISGQYNPNSPIDKFETSKILAMAAGYKYSGATEDETDYYTKAYEKNKLLLANYKNSFTKWNSTTDREVAYLLEREILTEADLAQFVIKTADTENLRALSRQEAAVFLVKLAGLKAVAETSSYANLFLDDAKITLAYKPYVYYLRQAGVVAGDAANTFNPNGAVTRAAMAVMLDKSLKLSNGSAQSVPVVSNTNSNVATVETVSGTIDKVHTSLVAVQIKYDSGETKIHKIEASANIYVDGFIKTVYDLKESMPIMCILKNGQVMDIKAQSITLTAPVTPTTPTPQTTTTAPTVSTDADYRTIQGTVTDVKSSAAETRSVTIEVRIINPSGGIIVESTTYTAGSDCRVTRGGADVDFSTIVVNDIVKAKVYNNKAYVLELEEKNRQFNATVIDKKTDATLGTNFFVVEDKNGKQHELIVAKTTKLTRKGMGDISFNEIRIGDTLDLIAEYATLKEAYAYGTQSFEEGTISEIHVTKNGTYVMLTTADNTTTKYYVIDGAFDVYTLRVNAKVRFRLDSKEIEAVSILQEAAVNYFTGYVDSISSKYIILRDTSSTSSDTTKVYYNLSTLVTDSTTGTKETVGSLYKNMKVYVVFDGSSSENARSITILAK